MDERLLAVYPELESAHFWWRVRREFVASLIEARRPVEGSSILDIGCGSGVTMQHLRALGAAHTVGVEVAREAIGSESQVSESIIVGDIMSVEIGERFDVVLMLDVLEHLESDEEAITRVVDLMRPNGLLIITVPAFMALWSDHDVLNAHFRRYRLAELQRLLSGAGLQLTQAGYMFAGLVLPKLISRVLERFGQQTSTSAVKMVRMNRLNSLAYRWFRAEARVGTRRPNMLPFGASVVAVATRSELS